MPAKKPVSLNTRNASKDVLSRREAAESSVQPKTGLTMTIPARLRGRDHTYAAATWKWAIGLFSETESTLATAFDQPLLIKFCLLEEEVVELEQMRRDVKSDWETNSKAAKKIKPNTETLKDWVAMWGVVNAQFQKFQGIDARLDGKRKLLHTLSQSLYLTPRSRAGAVPAEKEPQSDDDPMDALLNS